MPPVVPTQVVDFPTIPAASPTRIPEAARSPQAPGLTSSASPGFEFDQALTGAFKGRSVVLTGPFVDHEQVIFAGSVYDFEERTGIDIQYTGSKAFEMVITSRLAGGNPPDIAIFSQPSFLASLVARGQVVDLSKFISQDFLRSNFKQSWLDMATMKAPADKIMAGIWNRVNGKSLVWYPKSQFEKAGYQVPATWDELLALMKQIKKDGGTPWCVGIESGPATGWVATDWIEDILLRTTSLENYDRWIAGELKFSSPEVTNAVRLLSEVWFGPGNVYGGREAIVNTSFLDASRPMFEKPNRCWLHRQANFVTLLFPADARAGVDYDFFYLPPIDLRYGRPMLVDGDMVAMFNDRPEVRAVMEWFATVNSVAGWIDAGKGFSPHRDARSEWHPDVLNRRLAEAIQNADVLRFDGSDQMPGVVGVGSFWKQITLYISGAIDLSTALKTIDASWPKP